MLAVADEGGGVSVVIWLKETAPLLLGFLWTCIYLGMLYSLF